MVFKTQRKGTRRYRTTFQIYRCINPLYVESVRITGNEINLSLFRIIVLPIVVNVIVEFD